MTKNQTINDSLIGMFIVGINRSCDLCPLENSDCAKLSLVGGNDICVSKNMYANIQYPKCNSLSDSTSYLLGRIGGSYKTICNQLEQEGVLTVAQLIDYGFSKFIRLRHAGSIIATRLCAMLEEDYGVKDWNRT